PFPPTPTEIPDGGTGNFLSAEVAARGGPPPWQVTARLQPRLYARASSSFATGLSLDLELRHSKPHRIEPFLAIHTETLVSDRDWPDAKRFRAMAGISFPGAAGRLSLFGAMGSGNGYGLLINRDETQFSLGLRLGLY